MLAGGIPGPMRWPQFAPYKRRQNVQAEKAYLSSDAGERKATPIYSGVLRYFPDALAAVARLSKAGNDKHNPGQPLHWSRDKSNDHGDCLIRHQLEPEEIDQETGELHATSVAWRALAQLQLLEERRRLIALSGPMGRTEDAPAPASQADVSESVSWSGGLCPVDPRTQVRVKTILGEFGPYPAWAVQWDGPDHVIAYRVVG